MKPTSQRKSGKISFETDTNKTDSHIATLLAKETRRTRPLSCNNYVLILMSLLIVFVATIIGTVFITKSMIENSTTSSESRTTTPPKNLIVIISDGMGQNYNAGYRKYKNLTQTVIDQHFKGRYSTTPTNTDGIADSAAGATCFSCGVQTHNGFIGIDGAANPKGSILAAAKRKGKGTGVVVTKSVTDATPSSFTSHSLYRSWNDLIAKQQWKRQINGEPMIDILFGGGRRYFERNGFFRNETMWKQYGWNKVTDNSTEFINDLDNIDITQMPYMGLFADGSYPYYLDRLNGKVFFNDTIDGEIEYPDLIQMSEKAINLLSTKYEKEGFFLLVEASEVDWCGHDNDIVCMLWEMEEFMLTTEMILKWAENDGDTLVVMLSDHETGGFSIGRDGAYYDDLLIDYWDGKQPENGDVATAWYAFENDYSIAPPSAVSSFVSHYGAYKWKPQTIEGSLHTAYWFRSETGSSGHIDTLDKLYTALETMYLGGDGTLELTQVEKDFIAGIWTRSSSTREKAFAALMNARTMTGWTTHGHSGADCAVYAYGPSEDKFVGHFQNFEIGLLMMEIFDVVDEVEMETKYLEEIFMNGSLEICDPTNYVSYYEWENNVPYPAGNLLSGQYCVEQWI